MTDNMSIKFNSAVVPIKPVNDQFTLCKCYVMALGKNQNKSNISREAVENAMPSLFNIPVVGHLYIDQEDEARMGGHDMALVKGADGKHTIKMLTVPYGVVPQQDNVHFEDVEESDGSVKTYLVADVILWTGRYPELLEARYDDDIYFAESMEINPTKVTKEDGYINVEQYQYSALCLLGKSDNPGKNVEPCFEQSRVEAYEFSVSDECVQLFEEFKGELAKYYSQLDVEEGGNKALNNETIKQILVEFNLAEDTVLPFEITEDMTEDMLRDKIREVYSASEDNKDQDVAEEASEDATFEASEVSADADTDAVEDESTDEPLRYSVDLTYEERREKLASRLCSLNVWSENEYLAYWMKDFDDEYVYCDFRHGAVGVAEVHRNVRIPYSVVDSEIIFDLAQTEEVRLVWVTKDEENKLSEARAEFEQLKEYKAARLEDDRRKAYAAVIADFQDLGELDEYKAIVKDAMSFESVEVLTEKLYAIRGRYSKKPEKKPLSDIKIPVGFGANVKPKGYWDEFMETYSGSKK